MNKAVRLYSDVTATLQKKIIEDLSTSHATTVVLQQDQRNIDVDRVACKKKKLNVCINKVPESLKKSSKEQGNDNLNFCIESLEMDEQDISSYYRAG